ncbi:sodium-dependent noradrenaline transporter-like [Bicyclus anynana]|uniref:Sodium-dependent noradrenaline transporter-like n=1 Tax=Bicyclus anynana TaxID=110368 RepID=A0A6J1N5E8_BICAN|nr:sodium-dependent noradrenaline transporter-like [Bicyclus anynana]
MRQRYIDIPSVNNSSSCERTETNIRDHFRWKSIKQFLYIAHAFSSTSFSFDLFSKVLVVNAHIIEYIIYAMFIGISYMFMDFFIKQYTRRLDTIETLNPLMRGVSFGILLQTAVWTLMHACNLADSLRFLMASLDRSPSWTKCQRASNVSCLSSQELILNCRHDIMIDFSSTSAHVSYTKQFTSFDRNSLSMRLFVIAIVWISNFFIATISDEALLKLFKFSFLFGLFSTAYILIFLMCSSKYTTKAFYDIMDIKDGFKLNCFNLVTDPFGVGLIGAYDFGHISPFLMTDNAVIIFTIVFIAVAFARSLIVRVLYMKLTNCVNVKYVDTPHYLLFAILPLSTEFLDAHKVFVLYIYAYLLTALVSCLAMFTSTISRLLHSEFRSVKNIYIVGLLCFLGFTLSLPLSIFTTKRRLGVLYGLNICTLYLGGCKVAIVMWVYGVKRFSNDVQFWLGFKPTRFWVFLWATFPVLILVILINKIVKMLYLEDFHASIAWIFITVCFVLIFHVKIIAKYILKNNLAGILKSNPKYGPPELEDRIRRRNFNELFNSKQCRHECLIIDGKFECNHLPLMFKEKTTSEPSSPSSLTNIYDAGPSKKRPSSVMDACILHMS